MSQEKVTRYKEVGTLNKGYDLREQVKIAKVYNPEWKYKTFADCLGITEHSFYNWLKGYYNLNEENQQRLQQIIDNLKEN